MRIAITSGKGGTGKTTVATNLAVTAARAGRSVGYLDCDVEEPNGFLFLKPRIDQTRPVNVSIPKVDLAKCSGCGQCGRICQYSAIVSGMPRFVGPVVMREPLSCRSLRCPSA